MLVIYLPQLQKIFVTESLSLADLTFLVAITSTVFIASELKKLMQRRAMRREKQNQIYQNYMV
jgi:Ca2+-transporting ATPase